MWRITSLMDAGSWAATGESSRLPTGRVDSTFGAQLSKTHTHDKSSTLLVPRSNYNQSPGLWFHSPVGSLSRRNWARAAQLDSGPPSPHWTTSSVSRSFHKNQYITFGFDCHFLIQHLYRNTIVILNQNKIFNFIIFNNKSKMKRKNLPRRHFLPDSYQMLSVTTLSVRQVNM